MYAACARVPLARHTCQDGIDVVEANDLEGILAFRRNGSKIRLVTCGGLALFEIGANLPLLLRIRCRWANAIASPDPRAPAVADAVKGRRSDRHRGPTRAEGEVARERRSSLAPLAPHQPRPARNAADALEY